MFNLYVCFNRVCPPILNNNKQKQIEMKREAKKTRNDQIYGEYYEMFLRGEKNINEKLGEKYNLHPGSISRIRNAMVREKYGTKK